MTLLGRLLRNRRAGEARTAWNLPQPAGPRPADRHQPATSPTAARCRWSTARRTSAAPTCLPSWPGPRSPPGTAQLLLVVEDIDVPLARPAVHCVALVDPATGHLEPGALAARQPAPGVRCCAPPSDAATTVPHPSRATGRTATSSSCSPSAPPWTVTRAPYGPWTGRGPAPSCPPSAAPVLARGRLTGVYER